MAMISVKEAKFLIEENSRKVPVQPIPLAMALGATLGTEVSRSGLGIEVGARLTNSAISVLAGIGYKEVEVYRKPTVGIVVTGNALDDLGPDAGIGQLEQSNSPALTAALRQAKVMKINFYNAAKNLQSLTAVLKDAIQNNDIVILSCGVSSGCYDFVLNGSRNVGVTQIFDKVRQKPGKPLYFGKTDRKLVFGLPGDADAVLVSFNKYVLPAIEKLNNYTMNNGYLKNFKRV